MFYTYSPTRPGTHRFISTTMYARFLTMHVSISRRTGLPGCRKSGFFFTVVKKSSTFSTWTGYFLHVNVAKMNNDNEGARLTMPLDLCSRYEDIMWAPRRSVSPMQWEGGSYGGACRTISPPGAVPNHGSIDQDTYSVGDQDIPLDHDIGKTLPPFTSFILHATIGDLFEKPKTPAEMDVDKDSGPVMDWHEKSVCYFEEWSQIILRRQQKRGLRPIWILVTKSQCIWVVRSTTILDSSY